MPLDGAWPARTMMDQGGSIFCGNSDRAGGDTELRHPVEDCLLDNTGDLDNILGKTGCDARRD